MRTFTCKRCHVAGAEEPDAIRVHSLRRDPWGEVHATLECARCGHRWTSERAVADMLRLPGYREAAAHIEEPLSPARPLWTKR